MPGQKKAYTYHEKNLSSLMRIRENHDRMIDGRAPMIYSCASIGVIGPTNRIIDKQMRFWGIVCERGKDGVDRARAKMAAEQWRKHLEIEEWPTDAYDRCLDSIVNDEDHWFDKWAPQDGISKTKGDKPRQVKGKKNVKVVDDSDQNQGEGEKAKESCEAADDHNNAEDASDSASDSNHSSHEARKKDRFTIALLTIRQIYESSPDILGRISTFEREHNCTVTLYFETKLHKGKAKKRKHDEASNVRSKKAKVARQSE